MELDQQIIFNFLRSLNLKIFYKHPLHSLEEYCGYFSEAKSRLGNRSDNHTVLADIQVEDEPNTSLMSAILMFGTFFIAYFLRILRNSEFFGRSVRCFLNCVTHPTLLFILTG